jgi:hypothetical protein
MRAIDIVRLFFKLNWCIVRNKIAANAGVNYACNKY